MSKTMKTGAFDDGRFRNDGRAFVARHDEQDSRLDAPTDAKQPPNPNSNKSHPPTQVVLDLRSLLSLRRILLHYEAEQLGLTSQRSAAILSKEYNIIDMQAADESRPRRPLAYRIHFCDGATCAGRTCPCFQFCSPISPNALQHLIQEIPTIESIFYGHPHMMNNAAAKPDHLGICRLYLHPDFGVGRSEFELLVRCIKEIRAEVQPPALAAIMPDAILVAEKFGGSTAVDEYQHRLEAFSTSVERYERSPVQPAQDVDELYDWHTVGPIGDPSRFAQDSDELLLWQSRGFELATYCVPSHSPTHYVVLRRRKTARNNTSQENSSE